MSEVLYVRVMQQELNDEIRIGRTFVCYKIEEVEKSVIKGFDEKVAWCGGFTQENKEKYYKRIAIVDAESLSVIKIVYEQK